MFIENIINDEGEPFELDTNSYRGKVYLELQKTLKNFNEFLFIEFDCDDLSVPSTRFYPHDKRVLIWTSSEKKLNEIGQIRNDFYHIFANYYWDEENVTSIPLGYNNFLEANYIPINERHYDISFMGMLNKNRVDMVSALTGIHKKLIALGIHLNDNKVIKFLNDYLNMIDIKSKYFLSDQFNFGVNSFQYCNGLRHSKVVLAPKGFINTETFRIYEAMQYGCIVVTDKLPKRKYYEGIPAIQIDNWHDGIKQVKKILNDENLLLELSDMHRKFYNDKLSPIATANLIAKTLENKQ
jgi:hypothetical protein